MRILGFYIDKVIKNIQPRKFHGEELTVRAFTEYEWEWNASGSFALNCSDLFRKQGTFPDSSSVIDAMNNATNMKVMNDTITVTVDGR